MKVQNELFEELDCLVQKLLDDSILDAERVRLEYLLREDASVRRRYVEFVALESLLHWELGGAGGEETTTIRSPEPLVVNFAGWLRPALAMAATVVATVGLWWAFVPEEGGSAVAEGGDAPSGVATPSRETQPLVVFEDHEGIRFELELTGQGEEEHVVYFDAEEGSSLSALTASKTPVLLPREREALKRAMYPLAVLESGQDYAEDGYVERSGRISAWRGEDALRTGEEFGIQPFEGSDMFRFSQMEVDVFSQSAETTELMRVLDVRGFGKDISASKAVVKSSAFFNQGVGIADAGTEYAISMHAIDREGQRNMAVGREEERVMSDGNPETWEWVESEMELPEGTDFVVVSLTARKEGPQALLPDLSGHFADGFEVTMSVEGRPVYGRL